jgi:hypothetical protein
MSKQFEHRESYMHKCAKDVLKKWLDDSGAKSGYNHIGDITFRPNRNSGVWLEYPLADLGNGCNSMNQNWDEIWLTEDGEFGSEFVPTYEQCLEKYKVAPFAIIDIVCTHKGSPSIGIEICHKNPVSKEKLQKIIDFKESSGSNLELIEIDAMWILSQIHAPSKLEYRRLI